MYSLGSKMYSSNLVKISAITVLVISITACNSSSHSTQNISTPLPQQPDTDKAAADKAAADKAAADKAAADKAAADKAAADKAAADKAAADKAAADKAAADKAAADKAAADKAAADKAAADKAAADKAAADNTTNKSQISIIKGVSDKDYPVGTIKTTQEDLSWGLIDNHIKAKALEKTIYNQEYSVVLGATKLTSDSDAETGYVYLIDSEMNVSTKGLETKLDALPNIGNATYIGKAFTAQDSIDDTNYGVLKYTVDFDKKIGSGSIAFERMISIDNKMINDKVETPGFGQVVQLDQGSITGTQINSTARLSDQTGQYSLGFYGPKAEEVAGKVSFNGKDAVGFGGTRGKISK